MGVLAVTYASLRVPRSISATAVSAPEIRVPVEIVDDATK